MKLIGSIDGVEVNFDFYPPSTFRGIIPKQLDGQYILQLTVTDDFGNSDGGAYKYMYVDFKSLHFHILDENFKFQKDEGDKDYMKVQKLYEYKIIKNNYSYKELLSKYSHRELVNECSCN